MNENGWKFAQARKRRARKLAAKKRDVESLKEKRRSLRRLHFTYENRIKAWLYRDNFNVKRIVLFNGKAAVRSKKGVVTLHEIKKLEDIRILLRSL